MVDGVRLLPESRTLLSTMRSVESFTRTSELQITSSQLERLRGLVLQSLDFYEQIAATEPWTGYVSYRADTRTVVGCCGFKGDPSREGTVEISYFTFPEYEGQGFATGAAAAMLSLTAGHPDVQAVLAHTLPERNASCRVLEKCGFEGPLPVVDPDDGDVWQWRREPPGVDR